MALLEEQVQQVQGFRCGNEYVGNEQSSAISEANGKHSLTSLGPGCCPWPLLSTETLSCKKERKKKRYKEKLLVDYRFLLLFFSISACKHFDVFVIMLYFNIFQYLKCHSFYNKTLKLLSKAQHS